MDWAQFVGTEFHGISPGHADRFRMRIPASMKRREFKASRKWAGIIRRIVLYSEFNFVSGMAEWSGSRQHRSDQNDCEKRNSRNSPSLAVALN
jgi:hypothetical protein